ncbi:hypothetical protein [Moorena sp. SIO3H5]|uniref:hypothetical protein n=1 Tax=Moorena sp. SIO3H5 TaxID=2607834 RepID=UPI0013BC9E0C|nr:hypothetical protein [Moorena sp. SIO3H5]NEO69309.1 hypothetical protein [Moorena sp. SIO3H5]
MRYTKFLSFSLFSFPCSLFPAPCSLLPAPCSLLPKNQKFVPHKSYNCYIYISTNNTSQL